MGTFETKNATIQIVSYTVRGTRALNIGNPRVRELTEAAARLTGETEVQAVTRGLQDRLERVRHHRSGRSLADELDEIALHCGSVPVLDDRDPEEILGYDDHGVPT